MNKRLESADSYWETIEKETEKDFEIIEAVLKADRMNLSFFHPNGTSPKFVIDACNSHASNKRLIESLVAELKTHVPIKFSPALLMAMEAGF